MTAQGEQQPQLWRPLVVRGIAVHFVAPAISLIVGLLLLASGGIASVLGAWVLTAGFPLAVGAFVSDTRALAAPAAVWALWLVVVQAAGSGSSLPRTPFVLALVLAGLGAAAVWLAQRAVLPAVEGVEAEPVREELPDVEALLSVPQVPPLIDAATEVDDALADLLDEPIDEEALEEAQARAGVPLAALEDDSAADDSAPEDDDSQGQVEGEVGLDEGGHVIEFEAIRED
ncbi:MAG: hypothetical protein J7513_14455 [Solirubrobacteraceae bacterium]|nr:hypothetical protein [Solirubrobacteraceae bacterium]